MGDAPMEFDGVPSDLDEPARGGLPPPPVHTAEQMLPFDQLLWEHFERLCTRLAKLEGAPEHTRRYGVRGQAQGGIDIFSRAFDATYATYQCKRYEAVVPSDIKNAVTKFLDGEWAKKSRKFVFCTSASLDATQLANEVETQAIRLKRRRPQIAFEAWDANELSDKLRAHPDLVVEFFDWPWHERFFQPKVESQPSDLQVERHVSLESLDLDRSYRRVRIVHLDWAADRLQRRLKQFEREHPSEFELISDQIGIPPNPRLLKAAIEERPPWLIEADPATWAMLGRLAESQGEWAAAADAWVRRARTESGSSRADSLVSAAIASGIGEDEARHNDLMTQARHACPQHPRVRLEDLDQDLPAQALYDGLAAIRSEDPIVQAIIECRMALASLRKPDVTQAKTHLREAERLDGTSLNTRAVGVNVAVQSGRLDVLAGVALNATELRDAHREALSVRDELLKQHRWSESVRLLMLAADALALLDEREDAAKLLRQAEPGERTTADGPEVLAECAAGRAMNHLLALEFLEGAPEVPAVRRLRAEAYEEVGTPQQRANALEELEALADDGGAEAAEAAFTRLAATLGDRKTPWHEPSAEYLRAHGHVRAAVSAEVFYLARWHADYEGGEALLLPHINEMWAKATRLRLAAARGQFTAMREAADDLAAAGPSQGLRLEIGRAYARCGDYPRAQEVLLAPARDPAAPPVIRLEAYRLLLRLVGNERQNWTLAKQLLEEWTELRPGDPRASLWRSRVENQLARVHSSGVGRRT